MKSTGVHIIFFLLVLFTSSALLSLISSKLDPVYVVEKERIKLLQQKAPSIEALNLGNSHARALDFKVLRMNGFHIRRAGSDLFEACYLLEALLPMLPNLKIVFMNISPMVFAQDNGSNLWGNGNRRKIYAITPTLKSWRPIHGDYRNLILGKLSNLVREDHWKGVAYALRAELIPGSKRLKSDEEEEGVLNQDGSLGDPVQEGLGEVDMKVVIDGYRQLKALVISSKDASDESQEKLIQTTRLLREKNIRVIFYSTPFTAAAEELLEKSHPGAVPKTRARMERVQRECKAEYYDFWSDPSLIEKREYFFNETHLNQEGSRLFTQKLAKAARLDR